MKRFKVVKNSVFLMCIIVASYLLVTNTFGAKIDFSKYYTKTSCKSCAKVAYDKSQKDSYGNPRQYGLKLCEKCMKNMSSNSTYYKRGYTDYNCLAYALGKNKACSWTWPREWGASPSINMVKSYFTEKGYKIADYGGNVMQRSTSTIYVYAANKKVTHFSRAATLDYKYVENAATISKWGACSLYTTKTVNTYKASSGYGECVFMAYK